MTRDNRQDQATITGYCEVVTEKDKNNHDDIPPPIPLTTKQSVVLTAMN